MQYEQQNSLHTTLQSRYLYSLLELLLFVSREAIKEGIESMRNVAHGIGTDLPAAIDEALTQISNKSDSVKVVLVVTDGLWTGNIFRGVVELKKLGVLRFIVAIGNVDEEEFLQFVDSLDQTFIGNDFLYLQQIIDMVIERTCVEVTSIQPSQYCQDRNATDLQLKGRGFTINLNRNRAQCRFQTDNGPIVTRPVGEITKYNMTCEDPGINKTGTYVIQITLDGVTYVTSSVRLVVADCKVVRAVYYEV
ncbi:Anthrax toxin receptor 1, partial [Geodia barretti]